MNRWTTGILLGFAAMLVANGLLVWFAIGIDDPVVASYTTEAR